MSKSRYKSDMDRLVQLSPKFAAAAQKVYDEWDQNDEGFDEMLGTGGICQDIASAIVDVLYENGIEDATEVSFSIGEQHVAAYCKLSDGIYCVDISPSVYETGGGYNWKKIEGVVFDAQDISIDMISSSTEDWDQYLDDCY